MIHRLVAAALSAMIASMTIAQEPILFPPETFGQVVAPQTESLLGDIQLEAQMGAYNNEFVSSYGENSVFVRSGRAVGLLQVLTNVGHAPCTAFLVEDNKLITNNHCVPGILDNPKMKARGATYIAAVQFHAGFLHDGLSDGVRTFHVNPVPLETSKELDYTVLQVLGDANAEFGALRLSSVSLEDHAPLWVIGHPMGEAQRISREKCQAASPALTESRLRHTCDTLPGNSGSPVIDTDSKKVVALHHAGSRAGQINYAIPMFEILARSKVLKAAAPVPVVPDTKDLQAERDRLEKERALLKAQREELAAQAAELERLRAESDRLQAKATPAPERVATPPAAEPVAPTQHTKTRLEAAIEAEQALDLTRDKIRELQTRLKLAGYDPGFADGIAGPQSRQALTDWQTAQGIDATGYLTADQIALLKTQSEAAYRKHLKAVAATGRKARRKAAAAAPAPAPAQVLTPMNDLRSTTPGQLGTLK